LTVLIDACVLFPTVLRELVLGAGETGVFKPLWSDRILDEWRRAAARHGPSDADIAQTEIALATSKFPDALVTASADTIDRLSLPDADDVHVLAAAIDGGATELLTLNTKDFPTNTLSTNGILRRHPDEFLLEHWHADQTVITSVIHKVLDQAAAHGIDTSNPRGLLKKARLPRLGKALFQV
jgi:hypothetical protein